ncbi:adenosylcobinamide amidohydrolase [Actinomadura yumaensis]|uniref:Adenosylcobinamide amidohydrolase n=1 Tax=Actinomadura yumaensis TaxID=111807 RepID=A0ABW2CN05_9ACTN|nr:adenosylcobinamide amidohydrolase [Actinomadura sp. J1-007]
MWWAGPGIRTISSAMLGGGIGPASWVLNAQVPGAYSRMDPVEHLRELAAAYGLEGPGVGMLTAAAVYRTVIRTDGAVTASATVGLRVPTWAAAPENALDPELAPLNADPTDPPAPADAASSVPLVPPARGAKTPTATGAEASDADADAGAEATASASNTGSAGIASAADASGGADPADFTSRTDATNAVVRTDAASAVVRADGAGDVGRTGWTPGTVNIVVNVPVALTDGALVNAVVTATEAKTQALLEAGYPCTGTASDAVCIAVRTDGDAEPFAGPRSEWGARIARAVHAAVYEGALGYGAWLRARS